MDVKRPVTSCSLTVYILLGSISHVAPGRLHRSLLTTNTYLRRLHMSNSLTAAGDVVGELAFSCSSAPQILWACSVCDSVKKISFSSDLLCGALWLELQVPILSSPDQFMCRIQFHSSPSHYPYTRPRTRPHPTRRHELASAASTTSSPATPADPSPLQSAKAPLRLLRRRTASPACLLWSTPDDSTIPATSRAKAG